MSPKILIYGGSPLIVSERTLEHFGMQHGQDISSEELFWKILRFNSTWMQVEILQQMGKVEELKDHKQEADDGLKLIFEKAKGGVE